MKSVSKMNKTQILTTGILSAFFSSAATFVAVAMSFPSSKSIEPAKNKIKRSHCKVEDEDSKSTSNRGHGHTGKCTSSNAGFAKLTNTSITHALHRKKNGNNGHVHAMKFHSVVAN
jgi:hypothetical protein